MQTVINRMGTVAFTAAMVASMAAAQQMERGSFLREPAVSRAQLLRQIHNDPVVLARYERHFGMNEAELDRYFRTFHVETLTSSGHYLTWHVNPDGSMGKRYMPYTKGMKVFEDSQGHLALRMRCGNPLVSAPVAHREVPTPRVASNPPPPPVAAVAETPSAPPEVLAPPPPEAIAAPLPLAPPPTEIIPAVVPPPPEAPLPLPVIASGGGPNLWPLIIPIGGLLLLHPGGGGSGPPPVPEPTTMFAIATGVGMMVANRKRAKKL